MSSDSLARRDPLLGNGTDLCQHGCTNSAMSRHHGRALKSAPLPHSSESCIMSWDRPARKEANSKVRAVAVTHHLGFIGNKLFAIAAGITLAEVLQLPLAIPVRSSATMLRKGFSCLRSSPSLRGLAANQIEYVRPNAVFGINFQDLSIWGTANGSGVPLRASQSSAWLNLMRRAFHPNAGSLPLAPYPEAHDLVIHFRDLRDCAGWKTSRNGGTRSTYRTKSTGRWFYGLDLYSPPVAFFNAVIATHMGRFGPAARIWVVSQPCDRKHPTILALRSKWPVHFLTAHDAAVTCNSEPSCRSAVLDFIWMQAAAHIVLSPSTFGWWPAFLSTRAETVHYPLYPAFSPWGAHAWCHLMPEDDPRFLFHDVWANVTWRGGEIDGREARRRCETYMNACERDHVCAIDAPSAAAAQRTAPHVPEPRQVT